MQVDGKRVVRLSEFRENITKSGIWGRCGEISGLDIGEGKPSPLVSVQKYWIEPFSRISMAFGPTQASLAFVTKGVLTVGKDRQKRLGTAVLKRRSLAILEGEYVFTFMTGSMPTEFFMFNSRSMPSYNPEEYEHIKHVSLDDLDETTDDVGGLKVKASEAMVFDPKSNMVDFLELRLEEGDELKYHRNMYLEVFGLTEPQKGRLVLTEGTGTTIQKDVAMISTGLVGSIDNCHKVKAVGGPVRAFVFIEKLKGR